MRQNSKLIMILTLPSARPPFKMTWPWALLFCSISLVAGRQGHLSHNVKCTGWKKVCSHLTGVIAGPARVGTAVVIDCLNAFYKEGIDGRKVGYGSKWDTTETSIFWLSCFSPLGLKRTGEGCLTGNF